MGVYDVRAHMEALIEQRFPPELAALLAAFRYAHEQRNAASTKASQGETTWHETSRNKPN